MSPSTTNTPPPCIGNDLLCPCQDGLACHYKDAGKTKGWPVPPQSTIDKLMALVGQYADSNRRWEGPDPHLWIAIRAALAEALDLGEPVAYTNLIEIDWARRNPGRSGNLYSIPAGANDIPLYAAKDAK